MFRFIKHLFVSLVNISLCACLVAGYAFYIEPQIIKIKSYDIESNSKKENKKDGIKIIQLSDIHIGESYNIDQVQKLVNKVNEQKPDIIIFTGDLYDNYSTFTKKDEVEKCLKQLKASHGKYAIWGNRDYGGGASRVYEEIMSEGDFTLLKNSGDIIKIGKKNIYIGGVDDYLLGNPQISNLKKAMKKSNYNILLLHEPDAANEFKDSNANLILSGHSHGGQVKIPFYKGVTTSMAEIYTAGFYTINEKTDMKLYVHTGIGTTRINARFLVVPHVAIFNLY